MNKFLVLMALVLSPSAWALENVYLSQGESIVVGNYRVSCEGGGAPVGDFLTRTFTFDMDCHKSAQYINGAMSHDTVRLQATCANRRLTVRVSQMYYGQSARFRTQELPMETLRDLRDVLNSVQSSTLYVSAAITATPNNPNWGYVGFSISK